MRRDRRELLKRIREAERGSGGKDLEALLMERVDWERNAGKAMKEGEETWVEAFKFLRDRRVQWFAKYRNALEEGRALWREQSEELRAVLRRSSPAATRTSRATSE